MWKVKYENRLLAKDLSLFLYLEAIFSLPLNLLYMPVSINDGVCGKKSLIASDS